MRRLGRWCVGLCCVGLGPNWVWVRFQQAIRFFCTLSLPLRGSFAILEQKTASVTALMSEWRCRNDDVGMTMSESRTMSVTKSMSVTMSLVSSMRLQRNRRMFLLAAYSSCGGSSGRMWTMFRICFVLVKRPLWSGSCEAALAKRFLWSDPCEAFLDAILAKRSLWGIPWRDPCEAILVRCSLTRSLRGVPWRDPCKAILVRHSLTRSLRSDPCGAMCVGKLSEATEKSSNVSPSGCLRFRVGTWRSPCWVTMLSGPRGCPSGWRCWEDQEDVPLVDDVERTEKMSLWLTMLSGPRRCPSGWRCWADQEDVPLVDDVERTKKMSLWLTMLSGPRRCPSGWRCRADREEVPLGDDVFLTMLKLTCLRWWLTCLRLTCLGWWLTYLRLTRLGWWLTCFNLCEVRLTCFNLV